MQSVKVKSLLFSISHRKEVSCILYSWKLLPEENILHFHPLLAYCYGQNFYPVILITELIWRPLITAWVKFIPLNVMQRWLWAR